MLVESEEGDNSGDRGKSVGQVDVPPAHISLHVSLTTITTAARQWTVTNKRQTADCRRQYNTNEMYQYDNS